MDMLGLAEMSDFLQDLFMASAELFMYSSRHLMYVFFQNTYVFSCGKSFEFNQVNMKSIADEPRADLTY